MFNINTDLRRTVLTHTYISTPICEYYNFRWNSKSSHYKSATTTGICFIVTTDLYKIKTSSVQLYFFQKKTFISLTCMQRHNWKIKVETSRRKNNGRTSYTWINRCHKKVVVDLSKTLTKKCLISQTQIYVLEALKL